MQLAARLEVLESTIVEPNPNGGVYHPSSISLKIAQIIFPIIGFFFPKSSAQLALKIFSTPLVRAKHKVSDPILERAKVFDMLYGGKMLKAYEWGTGDKIVLLVHGWESRGTALRSFVPDLIEQGFKVVTFDGPAHGNSSGKQTNLPHFAGAIRAVINHIGGVHSIIAHSFGGSSTVYALMKEEKIAVEKLILIAPSTRLERVLNEFMKMINAPKKMTTAFFKILKKNIGMTIEEGDLATANGRINVKDTMLIHDEKDTIVPFTDAEHMARKWKNMTLLVTKGYGHYRLMKNPDLIKRVVHFIVD